MRAVDYQGRVVVITGGTRGIGAGIATAFLRAGAQVLVCGRTEPEGGSLPSAEDRTVPGEAGPPSPADGRTVPDGDPAQPAERRTAAFFRADVRDAAQARALIEHAAGLLGRVDVVINNAGGSPAAAAATASPRFHAKVIELNLIAPLHVAQAANAVMQDQSWGGSIIMIGSVSGVRPSPGTAAYGAAKAGLHNLARTLAVEWAPKVRVNSVVPGPVATESAGAAHWTGAGGEEAVARTVPLGRLPTPGDIADACLFLASPLASCVSGAELLLHGGGEWPAYLAQAGGPVYAPND